MTVPELTLSNGVHIPAMGLGTYSLTGDEGIAAIQTGLEMGYRLLDTAEAYGNEAEVGEGLRRSGVPREEVFITTKFNKQWHSVDGVRQAATASMSRLGVNYIDLLMIHWPNPDQGTYVDAVRGLMALVDDGVIHAIGTSNFKPTHLKRVMEETGLTPQVNQIKLSPWAARQDCVAYHREHGIVTESWSPIKPVALLVDPVVVRIAEDHGVTPAQVILRWNTQHGYLPIPKSAHTERLTENLASWNLQLTGDDMNALDGLDRGDVDLTDSDTFGH